MIPKKLHLYWGKNQPLSYLRKLTVDSFIKLNPDWEVNVYVPSRVSSIKSWNTSEHSLLNTGYDYLQDIKNVKVFDFESIDIPDNIPEVHKSDLLRWYLLGTEGGIWSDFDILYIRPITEQIMENWHGAGLCRYECDPEDPRRHHAIGFLISEGSLGRLFYKQLFNFGVKCIPMPGYQDFGAHLLETFLIYVWRIKATPFYFSPDLVYPCRHCWSFLKYFDSEFLEITDEAIGLHWYGGNIDCNAKELTITHETVHKYDMAICRAASRIMAPDKIKMPPVRVASRSAPAKEAIKYSIIMPYLKRSSQLKSTLDSFVNFYHKRNDYEVIIAKDAKNADDSIEESKLQEIIRDYKDKCNIVTFEYGDQNTWNPARAFNDAANIARGSILVLTNPECVHRSDILVGFDGEFEVKKDVYVVCSCFSINKFDINPTDELPPGHWYQHSKHRNIRCHFCSAISKRLYLDLGGFDERYGLGMGFDDDDFRNMIKKNHVKIVLRDDLLTVHLAHTGNVPKNYMELHDVNQRYYNAKWGENSMRAESFHLPLKKVDCLETIQGDK